MTPYRRLVILGATGSFGTKLGEVLEEEGLEPLRASRRPGLDLACDVEDGDSIRAVLRAGDVALDCVGPYQDRSPTLARAALEVGFDLVDLADAVGYARELVALDGDARGAGVRILTGQSSVSALVGRAVRAAGVERPREVAGLLVPAARHTAAVGSGASMLRSVGATVQAFEGGMLRERAGWRSTRVITPPRGEPVRGHLFETADLVHLPAEFPSLEAVSMYVHTNVPGLDGLLSLVDRVPGLPGVISRWLSFAAPVTRLLGGAEGLLAYEIRGEDGLIRRAAYRARETSPRIPVLPMALAALRLVRDEGPDPGVFPPARALDDPGLDRFLERNRISLEVSGSAP